MPWKRLYPEPVTTRWRNKRATGAYALSATNAYYWHAACPCQEPKPSGWRQIGGRGLEGQWASAWLAWLWRTHLQSRGYECRNAAARRVLDLNVPDGDIAGLHSAIIAGPSTEEPAPQPPFDPSVPPALGRV
jgi:hypothetical protein